MAAVWAGLRRAGCCCLGRHPQPRGTLAGRLAWRRAQPALLHPSCRTRTSPSATAGGAASNNSDGSGGRGDRGASRRLAARLAEAADQYYNGAPTMADSEYDALQDALRTLDPRHRLLTQVGAAPSGPSKVAHAFPMLSLRKAKTRDELQRWMEQYPSSSPACYCVSEKLDGIAVSLTYDAGRLVQGLGRGDGRRGEDLTAAVAAMQGLSGDGDGEVVTLDSLPFSGVVRGEVLCTESDRARYFPDATGPLRNVASGKARAVDPEGHRHLTFLAYQLFRQPGPTAPPAAPHPSWQGGKESEFRCLSDMGFRVPQWETAGTAEDVWAVFEDYEATRRGGLDYDIDGLVVELGRASDREAAGRTRTHPLGALALKFPSLTALTSLVGLDWRLGRSGRLTPVFRLEERLVGGAHIRSASAASVANVADLWEAATGRTGATPRVGDMVVVSRRNDVIPCVDRVAFTTDQGAELVPPTRCPACNTLLQPRDRHLFCPNPECSGRQVKRAQHWLTTVGAKGWGEALVAALFDQGLAANIVDLYTLSPATLAGAHRGPAGVKVGAGAARLHRSLHDSTTVSLPAFLTGLALPSIFETTAQAIVASAGCQTLGELQAMSLAQLEERGVPKADVLHEGLAANSKLIAGLQQHITIEPPATMRPGQLDGQALPWAGQMVCFSGFRDKALGARLEALGGQHQSSMTNRTTLLVVSEAPRSGGSGAGASTKIQRAARLGIPVLSRAECELILARGAPPTTHPE